MERKKNGTVKNFFSDLASGYAIGIAFIIPGFSGGSVAAILGIYERLVGAIADLFGSFKESIKTLLPIGLGLVLGAASLLFPLSLALEWAPLPTVSLFIGLAIGGLPSVTGKIDKGIKFSSVLATLIPTVLALSLALLPIGAEKNLFALDFGGYILLFLIGIIGSAALVVPGISGSMLLLILGYYNPIVKVLTEHLLLLRDIIPSLAVLGVTGLGILVGFFAISKLMKLLLSRYPSATYCAILGFIIGSLPTVYISTAKDAGLTLSALPTSPWHYVICALLLALGVAVSLSLIRFAKKKAE